MAEPLDMLKAIAQELDPGDASADARLEMFLEMAAERLHLPAFGGLAAQATVYLAAHLVTLANRASEEGSAAPGALRGISTGDQSRSFGAVGQTMVSAGDASLASTVYGEQFLSIRNSRVATAPKLVSV